MSQNFPCVRSSKARERREISRMWTQGAGHMPIGCCVEMGCTSRETPASVSARHAARSARRQPVPSGATLQMRTRSRSRARAARRDAPFIVRTCACVRMFVIALVLAVSLEPRVPPAAAPPKSFHIHTSMLVRLCASTNTFHTLQCRIPPSHPSIPIMQI